MPMNIEAENEIREHALAGRLDDAIETAVRVYGPELFGFLVGTMRDEYAAEEAYSMFLGKLLRGIAGFRWASSFRTWAYQVLHSALAEWRRGARPPAETLSRFAPVAESARLASALDRHMRLSRLEELRLTLDPEDQEMLILHVDRYMTFVEIATVTLGEDAMPDQIATEAARLRARFHRVTRRLREIMIDEGLGPDDAGHEVRRG